MAVVRHRLRAKLTRSEITRLDGCEIRNLGEDDDEALAELMLNAYRGTIDYNDEDIDDAREEVRQLSEGEYGKLMYGCSYVAETAGAIVGAVVVTLDKDENVPLLAFAMTSPDRKRSKVATTLMRYAVNSIIDAGHTGAIAYVTEGNTASERLASRFGFEIDDK